MPAENTGIAINDPEQIIRRISEFMQCLSIEATRPSASDILDLRQYLKTQSSVYLTMLPGQDLIEVVDRAQKIHLAGFVPVPHIAVRHIKSFDKFSDLIGKLRDSASVKRVLLVGGDSENTRGSIHNVLSVIESGILQTAGIMQVGITGFPDGHPSVSDEELEANLLTKLAALQRCEIEGHIVTQFCFESEPIIRWLTWLRNHGVDVPIHIGLAGPTSLMKWLNYARRCGVKASTAALVSQSGLVKKVFKSVAPDQIILRLAAASENGKLGEIIPHLFSFGGIGATAKWALPLTKGNFHVNPDGGFDAI